MCQRLWCNQDNHVRSLAYEIFVLKKLYPSFPLLTLLCFSIINFLTSIRKPSSYTQFSVLDNHSNLLYSQCTLDPTANMRLSTLIALGAPALPLMLASPFTKFANATSNATCSTQPYQIVGFETFTAAPGPRKPEIPEPFGASHLSFLFIDPNFGRPGSCIRSLAAGAGGSVADAGKYYPCVGNPSLEYSFDGKVLGLKHSFDCQE